MFSITADNANSVWIELAKLVKSNDAKIHTGRNRNVRELLNVMIKIMNPRHRWVVSRAPSINPAFAICEIIWILKGRRDSKFLNYWNSQLKRFAGDSEEYHGAYGYRLRKHHGVDQIEKAYQILKSNNDTRQVVLLIWDPCIDLPNENGLPVNEDIPCNIVSMLKVRDSKLHWTQIMRSNDIYLGLPYNVIQFSTLQENLASWLSIDVGHYCHYSDSLHLYENDYDAISLNSEYYGEQNDDQIKTNYETTINWLTRLERIVDEMIDKNYTQEHILHPPSLESAPVYIKNYYYVLAYEYARRNKYLGESIKAIEYITNPCLSRIVKNWHMKFNNQ